MGFSARILYTLISDSGFSQYSSCKSYAFVVITVARMQWDGRLLKDLVKHFFDALSRAFLWLFATNTVKWPESPLRSSWASHPCVGQNRTTTLALFLLVPMAHSAAGQCYSFTGSSSNGTPATVTFDLENLPSPNINSDAGGNRTFTYNLGGLRGNTVTVAAAGMTSTATSLVPGPTSTIVVTSGPSITSVYFGAATTGFVVTVALSNPQYGPSSPRNFLPEGLTKTPPALSYWPQGGLFVDIANSTTPVIFNAVVTAIGSTCPDPCAKVITTTTLAHVPGTDDTQRAIIGRIGVGESVKLTSNSDVIWKIASLSGDEGTLTPGVTPVPPDEFYPNEGFPTEQCSGTPSAEISGKQACFVAPNRNGSTLVTATTHNGLSCSVKLKTVRPERVLFQRLQVPENSPDYQLSYHGFGRFETFAITMESVAFVTPGDVSFANVLFQEKDQEPPHVDRRYNALSTVRTVSNGVETGRTNAWLLGCDYDRQIGKVENPVADVDAFFAYTVLEDRDKGKMHGPLIDFSLVRTTWSLRDNTVEFSKKQFGNFSDDGNFLVTPGLAKANLSRPAVEWDDFVPVVDQPGDRKGTACLHYVQRQFPLLP